VGQHRRLPRATSIDIEMAEAKPGHFNCQYVSTYDLVQDDRDVDCINRIIQIRFFSQ
jgi:hypothetical protein